MNNASNILYEFGPFRIDPGREVVLRDGQALAITPKAFEVLLVLVRRSLEVVSKDELMQAVWPGRVVEEANLSQCIFVLRKLLGDTRGERRYIVTLPGQGYRFAEQVRTFTRGEPTTSQGPSGNEDAVMDRPAESSTRPTTRKKVVFTVIGVLIVATVLAAGYFIRHRASPVATPAIATIAVQLAPAKSIAVLPFENLSDDKKNEYFVAGMQDLILTKLADIGGLKVVSRASTEKYTSHPDNLETIGQQLGVATFLEGSVQKAGNQVLINVQLVDATTNSHIWAQSYTRTLDNIFGVEGEVAQNVAEALNAKLTAAEAMRVARTFTANSAALDAYLRGEYHMAAFTHGEVKSEVADAVREYSEAVKLDAGFALAWARLASAQVFLHAMSGGAPSVAVQLGAAAKESVQRAFALQPDLAEAYLSQGIYDIWVTGHQDAALRAFVRARTLQPQNAMTWSWVAYVLMQQGKWKEAAEAVRHEAVLDPNGSLLTRAVVAWHLGDLAQSEAMYKRALALAPNSWVTLDSLANLYAYLGELPKLDQLIESASPAIKANPNFADTVGTYLTFRRDWPAARKLYANEKEPQNLHAAYYPVEVKRGDVEWYAGDRAAARIQYARAVPLIEAMQRQNPESVRWHGELGWVYARLGHDAEALQQGQLASSADESSRGAVGYAPRGALALARIEAQVGKAADAIASLDKLLSMPMDTWVSVPLLKLDPTWDPIRNDPRFQALLKKYAQPAPAPTSTTAPAVRSPI